MISETLESSAQARPFHHEALFYADEAEFLAGTVPFVRAGLEAGEPVWVVVPAARIDLLRDALGADAPAVEFSDMAQVGRNPARIIPAWQHFVSRFGRGTPLRGIGEPVYAERSVVERAECHLHESLLNVALRETPTLRLLCPYDAAHLDGASLERARRNHPYVQDGGGSRASAAYRPHDTASSFAAELPGPASDVRALRFGAEELRKVRRLVSAEAAAAGLPADRRHDLVMAANEVAGNSVRHGGGRGELRVWRDGGVLVCEVRDRGRITEPLVGRLYPDLDRQGGRGLWLANQVCDLVQVHSTAAGSVVRLHMRPG